MTKSVDRIKQTGEIFTRSSLVDETTEEIHKEDPKTFIDTSRTFLDPACGDGEFLRGVVRKIQMVRPKFTKQDWKHTIERQLFGVDLMWDNICDTIYYLLRSYSSSDEKVVLESSGFESVTMNSEELVSQTPEEINTFFTKERIYQDNKGVVEMRKAKDSKHFVEYRLNRKGKWGLVKKFVRANSLTEWDFENWCCKCCKPNHKLNKN